jgi:3-deoxy-D-manno-octulosonate 8-phosphate phosphatase KdsC-like HAD superfamily phosphatase
VLKCKKSTSVIELASQISRRRVLTFGDDVYDLAPLQSMTVEANPIDVVSLRVNDLVGATDSNEGGSGMETVAIVMGRTTEATMAIIQGQRVGIRRFLAARSAISAAPLSAIATRTA